MKAKIISTGEIINIADYARVTLDKCDDYGNPIEVPFEDIELIKDSSNNIDWRQIRIQSAIAVMRELCVQPEYNSLSENVVAAYSVRYADALVKKLKGE